MIVDLRGEHELVRSGAGDDRLQAAPHGRRRADHRVREHVVEETPVARRQPLDEPVLGRRERARMAAPQVHEGLLQRGEQTPALVVRLGREHVDAEHDVGALELADGLKRAR